MWRRSYRSSYYIFFLILIMLLLCLKPSHIDGSLLEGGSHHHQHHGHDDSKHADQHNSDQKTHAHNEHHPVKNETNTSISPVLNFLSKMEQSSKVKPNKSDRRRKGRKFRKNNKRKEKKFSRPFPFRIPRTSFSCRDRAPGYYADMEADCQVYRMCTARGGGQAFLCPEGTRFNQRTLVCDHKFRVTCSDSSNFFHRNLIMHEESMRTKGSMRATKKAQLRNKAATSKVLRKRPRLQSSEIININPRPNVIRTGRLNGRLRFAPLFEKRRKENFEKFAKALDMPSKNLKPTTLSKQKINRVSSLRNKTKQKPSNKNGSKSSTFSPKGKNKTSRKVESKNIKPKQAFKLTQNKNSRRNQNRDEDNLLGLPELPPDIPRNSPIFTFKTGPKGFSSSKKNNHNDLKDNSKETDFDDEEVETIGGQLLPPEAAGKSVAKFRKDTEGPTHNQLSIFLTPPPPVQTRLKSNAPLQLVGHVMTSNELSAFPDSPIVKIKQLASSEGRTGTASNGLNSSIEEQKKTAKEGRKRRPKNGRLTSKQAELKRQRSRGHIHEELPRSSGGGGHIVGLPIQLRPSGRGMPAPLVWISPASLARSPMVSLRKLKSPNHNELFKSGNVERALTMIFPGRSTGRFNPSCLECMSIKHNSNECPPCFLSVR